MDQAHSEALAPDPETEELVSRARGGDLRAFEDLHRAHVGRVHAICLRICGDRALAEDLTQDAFVRAWQKLEQYVPGTSFRAWLTRLAVNVALTDRRASKRRADRERAVATVPEAGPRPVGPGQRIDIERAIAELPPTARTVFVLHALEGYKHDEIARLLGVAEGTSKTHVHRARNALRKALTA